MAVSPRSDSSDCVVPQLPSANENASGSTMEALLCQVRAARRALQHGLVSDGDLASIERADNSEGKSSEPDTSEEDERPESVSFK